MHMMTWHILIFKHPRCYSHDLGRHCCCPRWSAASGSVIVVIVQLFSLELFSQAEAVLHLVLAVLVEGAWAFKDLLVLLVVVALGARFINGGDNVV